MEHTIKEAVGIMIQCTREKRDRLYQVLDITRKQTEVLSRQSRKQLMEYIHMKQEHIDAINLLDDRFNHLYGRVRHRLNTPGHTDKNGNQYQDYPRLVGMMSDIKGLMEEIYNIEQRNNEIIESKANGLKLKIREINLCKKRRDAYNQRAKTAGGVYIDSKS